MKVEVKKNNLETKKIWAESKNEKILYFQPSQGFGHVPKNVVICMNRGMETSSKVWSAAQGRIILIFYKSLLINLLFCFFVL